MSVDTWASWTIDLSPLSAEVSSGLTWHLSGWLGGYAAQNDRATLTASFRDSSNDELGTATIGPVTRGDRDDTTGLQQRQASGDLPTSTAQIVVTLEATRASGLNDGYADNLSLILSAD